jgi:hypothetical protein
MSASDVQNKYISGIIAALVHIRGHREGAFRREQLDDRSDEYAAYDPESGYETASRELTSLRSASIRASSEIV